MYIPQLGSSLCFVNRLLTKCLVVRTTNVSDVEGGGRMYVCIIKTNKKTQQPRKAANNNF
jgi:hypothetical protein